MHAVIKASLGERRQTATNHFTTVFIRMEWTYNRLKIEFNAVQELLDELNRLGADGWEVIHYEEKKPPKFGGKYESIVLLKKRRDENKKSI